MKANIAIVAALFLVNCASDPVKTEDPSTLEQAKTAEPVAEPVATAEPVVSAEPVAAKPKSCSEPGGCDQAQCKDKLECATEVPNKLDLYLRTTEGFSEAALPALSEMMAGFKKRKAKVELTLYFVGEGDAKSGFKAGHGPNEVSEDLRSVCAIAHYAKDDKYLDYLKCRAKDSRAKWESCTGATGIAAKTLKECADGDEGKQLLERSFAASKRLGIDATPAWVANGKYKFSGIRADEIKSKFCEHNKLDGCEPAAAKP